MGQWVVTVMSGFLCVMLLALMGCRETPRTGLQAPVSEGRNHVREAPVRETVATTEPQRSPMDMPDWYRELLRKTPPAEQPFTVEEDVSTVRGYW